MKIKLISIMFANNETGIIQPLKTICNIAHKYNFFVHSDCVQALGKVKLSGTIRTKLTYSNCTVSIYNN